MSREMANRFGFALARCRAGSRRTVVPTMTRKLRPILFQRITILVFRMRSLPQAVGRESAATQWFLKWP